LCIEYDGYYYHRKRKKDEKKSRLLNQDGKKVIRIREFLDSNRILPALQAHDTILISYWYEESLEKLFWQLIDVLKKMVGDSRLHQQLETLDINPERDRQIIYQIARKNEREKSLAVKKPYHASYWHPEKNGIYSAYNVRPGSERIVWWYCKNCQKEWQQMVKIRTKSHYGCPFCRKY
jgi:hypothetical protein